MLKRAIKINIYKYKTGLKLPSPKADLWTGIAGKLNVNAKIIPLFGLVGRVDLAAKQSYRNTMC